mgnify:CR=1 FL=1
MSEDCLNLNVWTTQAAGARAPVMVWIHGGRFEVGDHTEPMPTAALGRSWSDDELAQWLDTAGVQYERPDDVAEVARRYRDRCDTLGRRVRLSLPGERTVEGVADDVDEQGRIVVRTDDGQSFTAAAGDVLHLRPAQD